MLMHLNPYARHWISRMFTLVEVAGANECTFTLAPAISLFLRVRSLVLRRKYRNENTTSENLSKMGDQTKLSANASTGDV